MPPRRAVSARRAVPSGHAPVIRHFVPPRRAARAVPVLPSVPLRPLAPVVRKRKRMFLHSVAAVYFVPHILLDTSCSLSMCFVFYVQ